MVKRKMKLDIKGNFKRFLADFWLKRQMKDVGVVIEDIKHHDEEHVEVVVSGYKEDLWSAVKSTKNQNVFLVLNEVRFQFVD